MMPRLDGFSLLKALRNDSKLRDVPVIFLSARAGEEAKVEGLEAGADDYLSKPFSARELLARVRANIDMAALRREAVRTENELRLEAQMAQERAEGILASINDGFFALDRDWRFTYVNAAAERMLSRSAEQLIGKNYWEEYPATVGSRPGGQLPKRHDRAGGRDLRVLLSAVEPLVRHPRLSGGARACRSTFRTSPRESRPKKRCAASTNGSRCRFPSARRNCRPRKRGCGPSLQPATPIRACSRSTARCWMPMPPRFQVSGDAGRGGRQAVLGDALVLGHARHARGGQSAVAAVAGGETVRQEIHVNLPVGGWRWFDFQMRPVRDEEGKVVAIVPEAVELTERRQAEEAFRQAQKMEAIGHLTGGVAHDFNNLLTVIRSSADLLRRRNLTADKMRRYVDAISDTADRAAKLTGQLLTFARRHALHRQVFDAADQLERVADMLKTVLGSSATFELDISGRPLAGRGGRQSIRDGAGQSCRKCPGRDGQRRDP